MFRLKQEVKKWGASFSALADFYFFYYYFFFEERNLIDFFAYWGNFPFFKHDRKIISSGWQIGLPQFFNVRILIIS